MFYTRNIIQGTCKFLYLQLHFEFAYWISNEISFLLRCVQRIDVSRNDCIDGLDLYFAMN